ncbi:MAG: DNA cytosine methyltransferase [Nannocystis sp.]|nr:DNA cytosine methyltransferase [Nannocystis sp.]
MTIGSLFSGIGGLELGLERAGLGPVMWQCEIDADARTVLRRHWPSAELHRDVRALDAATLPHVDVICGGFPCQDLSSANVVARSGLDGKRSGLWVEYLRVVRDVRPRWVVVENVGAVWPEWVPVVRGDLHAIGYPSVPLRVSTADVGLTHHRDRVFVVADADREGQSLRAIHAALAGVLAATGRDREDARAACREAVSRDDGLPARLARLPGNSVSPAVSEVIGRAIRAVTEVRHGRGLQLWRRGNEQRDA